MRRGTPPWFDSAMSDEERAEQAELDEQFEEQRVLIASVEELRALLAPLSEEDRGRVLDLARELNHGTDPEARF